MQYVLTGFTHVEQFRVFAFQGVAKDHSREAFWVRADLGLLRRYSIPMQSLPLLCRNLLEQRDMQVQQRMFTLTEADMSDELKAAEARRDLSAQKRASVRRSVRSNDLGGKFRGAFGRYDATTRG